MGIKQIIFGVGFALVMTSIVIGAPILTYRLLANPHPDIYGATFNYFQEFGLDAKGIATSYARVTEDSTKEYYVFQSSDKPRFLHGRPHAPSEEETSLLFDTFAFLSEERPLLAPAQDASLSYKGIERNDGEGLPDSLTRSHHGFVAYYYVPSSEESGVTGHYRGYAYWMRDYVFSSL